MSENGADVSWNDVGKVLEDERSSVEDIQTDLARNNKGNICQSIDNCMTVFQRDPLLKGAIRKNELSGKIDIVGNLGWERTSSSLTDTDVYQLHWYLEKEYGLKNERNINKAMNIAASENRYHPIREYLEQLVWDGKYRIGRLLPKYLGAEEDAYTREIMQLLMLAAIHRVYEPGCKYEIMVCLVGGQGAGKSTFFRFLAINDEWFSDDLKRMGIFAEHYKKRRFLRENTFRCICSDIGWKPCNRTGGISTKQCGMCNGADAFHAVSNAKERIAGGNGKYIWKCPTCCFADRRSQR